VHISLSTIATSQGSPVSPPLLPELAPPPLPPEKERLPVLLHATPRPALAANITPETSHIRIKDLCFPISPVVT
jgi:hypothetical protein